MKNSFSPNKASVLFLTVVVFLIIFLQAIIPLWKNHLVVDIWVYFARAGHFFTYHTLANLVGNEHLPGALFYFFIPSLVFFIEKSLDFYIWWFFLLGFILLLAHIFVYEKMAGYCSIIVFLLILLFSGPILLFRFELAVSLLVLLSIYFFKKRKIFWSFFFLGIAVTTKIYPILILPYYCLIFLKEKEYRNLLNALSYFSLGVGIITGSYFLIGGSLKGLLASFEFHALKPLGLESPITSIFLLFFKSYYGRLPSLIGDYGVWGIKIDFLPVNLTFFNLLPFVFVFLFYLLIYFSQPLNKEPKTQVIFLIFLIFLIFSKNLNPQYLFWVFSLVPVLAINKKRRNEDSFLLILITVLAIVLLTQYIYPILYTDLINNFYKNNKVFTPVIYLLFLRNFLLLILLMISGYNFLFKKHIG